MTIPDNDTLSTVYETWSKHAPTDSQERIWNRIVHTLDAPQPVRKSRWVLPVVYSRSLVVAFSVILLIIGVQWHREQQYRELANYVHDLTQGNVTLEISDNDESVLQEI